MPAETPIAVKQPATDTEATTRMPSLTLMLWKRSSGRTSRARSMTVPPTFLAPAFTAAARSHTGPGTWSRSSRRPLRRLVGRGLGLQGVADAVHRPDPVRPDLAP